MIQATLTGFAYTNEEYLAATATGMCTLATWLLAKRIRKIIGI